MKSLKERFEEKYMPEPNSGCWLWLASASSGGYGSMMVDRINKTATHVSLFLKNGTWPKPYPKFCVCHKCDNPSCVNPDHLYEGTSKTNFDDYIARKWNKNKDRGYVMEKLRKYLYDNDMRASDLAAVIGVPVSTVTRLLRREIRNPSLELMTKVAKGTHNNILPTDFMNDRREASDK